MDPAIGVWALNLANLAIWVVESAADFLFGVTLTRGRRSERRAAAAAGFSRSAQLVSVLAKANYNPAFPSPINSAFIFRHVDYVDPRVILKNDSIHPSHVDSDGTAYFAVPRGGVDFFDTVKYPFLCVALYYGSDHYLRITPGTLRALAEEAGDPRVRVGLAAMTLRCGSTLVAQIMANLPGTRSLSEPPVFGTLWYWRFRRRMDDEGLREAQRSMLRLTLRVAPDSELRSIFVKFDAFVNPSLDTVRDHLPDAFIVATTRRPKPSVRSFRKLIVSFTSGLYGRTGGCWRTLTAPAPVPRRFRAVRDRLSWWRQTLTWDEVAALFYAGSLACMKEYSHVFDLAVVYEDLVSDPKAAVRLLLECAGVAGENLEAEVERGLSALERDSQSGVFAHRVAEEVSPELESAMLGFYSDLELDGLEAECTVGDFRRFVQQNVCARTTTSSSNL